MVSERGITGLKAQVTGHKPQVQCVELGVLKPCDLWLVTVFGK